jgi:cytochrome c
MSTALGLPSKETWKASHYVGCLLSIVKILQAPASAKMLRRVPTTKGIAVLVLPLLSVASACTQQAAPQITRVAEPGDQILQACAQCHSLTRANRPTGPTLVGLMGRPAAMSDGYFYSAALRKSGVIWTSQTLDAYLANPQGFVPESFMLVGVPDPGTRAAVIAALGRLR